MGTSHYGAKNPNWRGGRSVTEHGYVLIRVGTKHHLADVRGYAYEHRLVAEEKIGRRLKKGEIPHHINGKRDDNRPCNIEVCPSAAHHFAHHRSGIKRLRNPGERNPIVCCACDCGSKFKKFDTSGRFRQWVPGHNLRCL